MTTNTWKFLKSFLVCINLCLVACYLVACVLPYADTRRYWYMALPGLIFPLIVFGLIFFILIWAFAKSKWFWVSVAALLLGFQQIITVFGFNFPKKFLYDKKPNTIRILQWNVTNWNESDKESEHKKSYRPLMMDLLKKQDADVLCLEEFFEAKDTGYFKSNISAIVKMGYSYYYFMPSGNYDNNYRSGIAIFSKHQMIDSATVSFDKNYSNEHLLFTDIKINGKTFRIFATHLQSIHFEESDYESLHKLKHAQESGLKDSRTIVSKLKKGYRARYEQAEIVSQMIKESPYPSIICGDFNDVPNSSTYFKIRGNLQDAFLKEGTWLGRTFRFISPTLRIDYILVDKKFSVTQYQRIKVPYSDHYPVEADLEY